MIKILLFLIPAKLYSLAHYNRKNDYVILRASSKTHGLSNTYNIIVVKQFWKFITYFRLI